MKLQITIDGKAYAVDVEVLNDEESALASVSASYHATHLAGAHSPSHGGTWDADTKECRSSVTGLVIKVNVEPGQMVEADCLIMVLEAMKMETNITAPHSGKVKNVRVAQGDSVKVNQVLVEFE